MSGLLEVFGKPQLSIRGSRSPRHWQHHEWWGDNWFCTCSGNRHPCSGNRHPKQLRFDSTSDITPSGWSALSDILYDKSSIDSIYVSNRILQEIGRWNRKILFLSCKWIKTKIKLKSRYSPAFFLKASTTCRIFWKWNWKYCLMQFLQGWYWISTTLSSCSKYAIVVWFWWWRKSNRYGGKEETNLLEKMIRKKNIFINWRP